MYTLDTHVHADHITGAASIKKKLGSQIGISQHSGTTCADILLTENQEVKFGSFIIKAIETPGHTNSCMSFYCDGMVFTGDSLLIGGSGRTDFQQGSSAKLYESITGKLFKLPSETLVYPGHDYRGFTVSTIGDEMNFNSRIGSNKSEADFIKIMSELKLAHPKKINEAVPANLKCGAIEKLENIFNPQIVDGISEITPDDLFKNRIRVRIIDVRSLDEYYSDLGHVEGAQLKTLGPELEFFLENETDKDSEIVFVCRSGGRSGSATRLAMQKGFKNAINMNGGMLLWNRYILPIKTNP
jgi:sulfur dioxygenase